MISWRVCPSHPDYEVSEYGGLRRCKPNRKGWMSGVEMKPRTTVHGYLLFVVSVNGKVKKVYAHHLVLEAFVGLKPSDLAQACHGDGNRVNNHYSNLRWDTAKANQADRLRHGTDSRGEKNPIAKLTEEQVRQIRELICVGQSQRQIAKQFSISQGAVSNINTNTNWSHV